MSVTTPVHAYISNLIPGTCMGRSANATAACSVGGFEAYLPIHMIQPGTASNAAGWECYAYASTDGGANYETIASVSFSVTVGNATNDRRRLTLGPGVWLIRLITGGSCASTYSFDVGTMDVITADLNA